MNGSRQLIEVLSAWQSCEDLSGSSTTTARQEKPRKLDDEALAQTIENQIIPRLMLTHRVSATKSLPTGSPLIDKVHVQEMARLILLHDTGVAAAFVDTLREQGASVDSIFRELLAPTARYLGDLWNQDLCDFTDVTVGLTRLQSLCMELSSNFDSDEYRAFDNRRVLLATVPGEQHTLGLMLVEEYFRRAGWECCSIVPKSISELARIVKRQNFDVVGISVSCEVLLEATASAIQAIRRSSKNDSVSVIVGGAIFLDHPEYAARIGADGTADDGRSALVQLRNGIGAKSISD